MEHPGTIVFVDEAAGTEERRDASEVPEGIAFATVHDVKVPVVRIVTRVRDGVRVIRAYGQRGQLLKTTREAPRPPR